MKFYNTNFLWGPVESDHPGAPRVRGGDKSPIFRPPTIREMRGGSRYVQLHIKLVWPLVTVHRFAA